MPARWRGQTTPSDHPHLFAVSFVSVPAERNSQVTVAKTRPLDEGERLLRRLYAEFILEPRIRELQHKQDQLEDVERILKINARVRANQR